MVEKLGKILVEISAGELIDKITILEIKKSKISNKEKLLEVEKELLILNKTIKENIIGFSQISNLRDRLKEINLTLWDIENGKRKAGRENNFNEEFVKLARNVYKFNDERAKIKLEINNKLGSNIKEVKSFN